MLKIEEHKLNSVYCHIPIVMASTVTDKQVMTHSTTECYSATPLLPVPAITDIICLLCKYT